MRTVDPELWSKSFKKRKINLTRPNNFGKKISINFETSLRKSFGITVKHFVKHTSIGGIRILVDKELTLRER